MEQRISGEISASEMANIRMNVLYVAERLSGGDRKIVTAVAADLEKYVLAGQSGKTS